MRVLAAILIFSISLNAAAWWNDEWVQRKKIVIDTTATGANTQVTINEVPVLIRLHSGNFPQFLMVRDNAADFRLVSGDDLTPLKYHVERFDPISELAFVWVKVPVVNPQTELGEIFLYSINPAGQKADDPGATFDVNTVAVFHFNEKTGLPGDSTNYATSVLSGQVLPNPVSLIGTGATLTGVEPLVIGGAPQLELNPETGWSFEAWVRLSGLPEDSAYLLDYGEEEARLSLSFRDSALIAEYNGVEVTSFAPVNATQWHHVALTVGADSLQLYLDGKQVGGAAVEALAITGNVRIGGSVAGDGMLSADVDELRISNTVRTPDWIAFSAGVQGTANDRVLHYQMDEFGEGESDVSTGHFGIILQNVFGKPEAWVEQTVIILCGLLMAIAIVIIFIKSVDLYRASRATKRFLHAFTTLGQAHGPEDLGAFYAAREEFSDSPLWRVYRVGIDEIGKTVSSAGGVEGSRVAPKSMAVVRASMDATMVREGQRLNSKLVLLTIAISGGPFIGLFGTVVGVMVTFAAIAATGEVNIAEIAPGMAAALLATVAGLGVAIPSLFGYNWLSSRVKELVADMHVFANELEARFNNQYG